MNTPNNWISMTERLPEPGKAVWLAQKGGPICRGYHYYCGSSSVFYSEAGVPCYPTHWQPLPEPPPVPDAFQEWWKKQNLPELEDFWEHQAEIIWDAAIASVKGEGR